MPAGRNYSSVRTLNRHGKEGVEVSAGVDVQVHNTPCGINAECVGQCRVERRIARNIYGDGRGLPKALQEAVLVAVNVIVETDEIGRRIDAPKSA